MIYIVPHFKFVRNYFIKVEILRISSFLFIFPFSFSVFLTLVVCIYDFGRKRKIFLKTLCAGGASAKVALRSLGRGESVRVGLFSFFGDLSNND